MFSTMNFFFRNSEHTIRGITVYAGKFSSIVEFALLQVEVQKLTSPKNPKINLRPQARLEAKTGMYMANPRGVEIEPK